MIKTETSHFNRLIGVWKTTGQISIGNQALTLEGTDSYDLILNGNYILHKADVLMGSEKTETFEIIGLNNTTNKASMQYFNSKGESGTMTGEISGNNFHIDGDKIKFNGIIDDQSSVIKGKWFLQADDNSWKEFIEMKLEKL